MLGSVHYLDCPDQMFDTIPDGAGQFVGRDPNEIYTGLLFTSLRHG